VTIPRKLKEHLDQEHIAFETVFHAPTHDSEHTAATMHIPGIEMAKAVVLCGGDKTLLAVLPASYRINLGKLAGLAGVPMRLATKEECARLFPDCEPDAVPPFGELYGLPVYMDQALADDPEIVFCAGSACNAVRMGNLDFVRLAKPRICSFADKPWRKSTASSETTAQLSDALAYHQSGRKGKIEVVPTKPCRTQADLSLAYTPGVAEPCRQIAKSPDLSFEYTARGNLVAVVTNGTRVLGLGNIGPLAGKPVMEGKAVLFKRFGDVDVFDLEVNSEKPEDVIQFCKLLEPTVGGINLEDIRTPDCFLIEETLRKTLSIPVMHDDQHGTAMVSGAAFLGALEIVGKRIHDVRVVFVGAGAAGIACAAHYLRLGVRQENLLMVDSKGVIYTDRAEGMNEYKLRFARPTTLRTLSEALRDADVLVGLSTKGAVAPAMLKAMAPHPIVFALANPDPEISPEEAHAARNDLILATGRSDYPNQVNNVLGFPFVFRAALDLHASAINEEMKLAVTRALADLARENVPDSVCKAYGVKELRFGPECIVPKPFDPRALAWVSTAVAKAAIKSGVARRPVDLRTYRKRLERMAAQLNP
jgi:malate dehydrogenase (oxaloacetate-decarboxylating)(NADP+)